MSANSEKLAELRRAVRVAWMTGVPNYREHYDKELFALLGITTLQELYPEAPTPAPDEAGSGYTMVGGTKVYCCYGMYCDVGHSTNCKYAKAST